MFTKSILIPYTGPSYRTLMSVYTEKAAINRVNTAKRQKQLVLSILL